MRTSLGMIVLSAAVALGACGKSEDKKDPAGAAGAKTPGKADSGKADPGKAPASGDPVAAVGVEAGGFEREADEGAAAVLTAASGTVEVRRVGEPTYAAIAAGDALYAGDQLRTGDGAAATVTFADESVAELAEVSTLGVGSRDGTADPASSAAVLAGLARFTVTDRAPGEGAFRVYTPAGVVLTKGTVYGVGVAASGEARVGVEAGAVDVVGLADLAAEPVAIEAGHAASLEAAGTVEAPVAWADDDWGVWRDSADAEVELVAAVDGHAAALTGLGAGLATAYADLETVAVSFGELEAKAAVAADAGATADYEVVLPEASADLEASFAVAGNIEAMTWAYAGHAELAAGIYERHPEVVEPRWTVVAPHVDAAVLWPKRFEVTAAATLQPLRAQYYVHHPRGRVHAELVGVAVPEFYAKVEPPEVDEAKVRGRVKVKVWRRPVVLVKPSPRSVWVSAPQANWHAKVKVKPARARAKVAWYVRPPELKAKAFVGVKVKAVVKPKIVVGARAPRARVRVHGGDAAKVVVGAKVKVRAPDLSLAAKARAKVKVQGGVIVRDHRGAGVAVPDAPDVGVKVRDHRDAAADVKGSVKGKADVKVRDHRGQAADVKGKVKAGADVKVKVKAPEVKVKVKAPKVKVKGKAEGKVKVGF